MLRPRLGLGLRPPGDGESSLLASIVSHPNYTASVAGTNVSTTRATSMTCPFTGITLGNNIPCTRRIYLGGKAHDAFGAWPQYQQLLTQSNNLAAWQFLDATPSGNTVTEGSAGSSYAATPSSSPFTAAATICATIKVRSSTLTWLRVIVRDSSTSNGCSIWINLQTKKLGTVSNAGSGTGWSATATVQSDGFIRLVIIGSCGGAGTTATIRSVSASANGSITKVNGSVYEIKQAQLTQSLVAFPYAETTSSPVTVNENKHLMTVNVGVSGAYLVCAVPTFWSVGANIAHPSAGQARLCEAAANDGVYRTNNDFVNKVDAGGTQGPTTSGLSLTENVPTTRFCTWDSSAVSMFRDGVFSISDTSLSPPYTTRTSIGIGCSPATANQNWCGLVLVGVCDGFIPSASAMGAWHRSVVRALQPLSAPIL